MSLGACQDSVSPSDIVFSFLVYSFKLRLLFSCNMFGTIKVIF